jgi:hypothetical protein
MIPNKKQIFPIWEKQRFLRRNYDFNDSFAFIVDSFLLIFVMI